MPVAGNATDGWEWSDALDALTAAPEHHRVLFENDEIRVLDTRIGPGDTVPVHTHRWPGVLYTIATDDLVRRDADGNVLLDTRLAGARPESGVAFWTAALPPHTVENVGGSEIRLLNFELKRSE